MCLCHVRFPSEQIAFRTWIVHDFQAHRDEELELEVREDSCSSVSPFWCAKLDLTIAVLEWQEDPMPKAKELPRDHFSHCSPECLDRKGFLK